MKPQNPFLISGYISPGYFCDRKVETTKLMDAVQSGRNVTLYSIRRMGKTGLLKHLGYHLDRKLGAKFLYTDIFSTENFNEMVLKLGNSLLRQQQDHKNLFSWLNSVFKSIRPIISYDPVTGVPELSIDVMSQKQGLSTLDDIFNFIARQKTKYVWAIDEFQQIAHYPEKKTESILRTYLQHMNNGSFIFSGSRKDMLFSIFSDSKRPFYQSTQLFELTEIDGKIYRNFIRKHFENAGVKLKEEALDLIFEYTQSHTWYVQMLCNRLYDLREHTFTPDHVRKVMERIISEYEPVYFNYRAIQTQLQWKLLKAIAIEGRVHSPNSAEFIHSHDLGSAPSVNRALNSLADQEHITKVTDGSGDTYYRLNDVFLQLWIQWLR